MYRMINSPSYLPSGYCSSSASLTSNTPRCVVRRPTVNGPLRPRMVRSVSWPPTIMGDVDAFAVVRAMRHLLVNEGIDSATRHETDKEKVEQPVRGKVRMAYAFNCCIPTAR